VAGLAVEADEAFELVGRLADQLGSDAHGKPRNGDRWFTRRACVSLCRGN
jgi:hypothetical protein